MEIRLGSMFTSYFQHFISGSTGVYKDEVLIMKYLQRMCRKTPCSVQCCSLLYMFPIQLHTKAIRCTEALLVPDPKHKSHKRAYSWSLCSSLTS